MHFTQERWSNNVPLSLKKLPKYAAACAPALLSRLLSFFQSSLRVQSDWPLIICLDSLGSKGAVSHTEERTGLMVSIKFCSSKLPNFQLSE